LTAIGKLRTPPYFKRWNSIHLDTLRSRPSRPSSFAFAGQDLGGVKCVRGGLNLLGGYLTHLFCRSTRSVWRHLAYRGNLLQGKRGPCLSLAGGGSEWWSSRYLGSITTRQTRCEAVLPQVAQGLRYSPRTIVTDTLRSYVATRIGVAHRQGGRL